MPEAMRACKFSDKESSNAGKQMAVGERSTDGRLVLGSTSALKNHECTENYECNEGQTGGWFWDQQVH